MMKSKLRLFKIKEVLIVSIILVILLTSISVGYALYNEKFDLTGNITLNKVGLVEITNVDVIEEDNITNGSYIKSSHFTETGINVNFNITAHGNIADNGELKYHVTFKNNSAYTYTYSGLTFANNASYVAPRLLGLLNGSILQPGEEIDATVIIFSEDKMLAETQLEYNITFSFIQGENDIDSTPLEIRNKNGNEFNYNNEPLLISLKVINLQDVSMKYYIKVNNDNFMVTNSSGKETKYTNIISPGDSDTNNIYLVAKNDIETTNEVIIQMVMEDGRIINSPTITINKKSPLLPGVSANITAKELWPGYYGIIIPLTNNSTVNYPRFTLCMKFKKPINQFNYYGDYHYSYDATEQIFKVNNGNRYNDTIFSELNIGETVDLFMKNNSYMMVVSAPEGLTSEDIEIIYLVDTNEQI